MNLTTTAAAALEAIRAGAGSPSEIGAAIGKSSKTVERARAELLHAGLIVASGSGRAVRYAVANPATMPVTDDGQATGKMAGKWRANDGQKSTDDEASSSFIYLKAKQLAASGLVEHGHGCPSSQCPSSGGCPSSGDGQGQAFAIIRHLLDETAQLRGRLEACERARLALAPPPSAPSPVAPVAPAPAREVAAAFNGDEPLEPGERPRLHARSGPGAPGDDPDAAEKDESVRRFVALLVREGHREMDAEATAMRHRGNPRLRMAVASVELKLARGKEASASLAGWLMRSPGEIGEPGSAGNWREIDAALKTAKPAAPRAQGRASRPALESIPTPNDRIESNEDKRLRALAEAELDRQALERGKR
jgi:hypothetical protein